MKAPVWLTRRVVLTIQEKLLALHGGLQGVRDEGLLDSALARPQRLLDYGHPDVFDLAASYAFGIARNHPFLDGNKRAAFMAAYSFLFVNGMELEAAETDAVLKTLALAAGEIEENDYARWLRATSVPR